MTPRIVRFTATARRHVQREQAWWTENREHVEVFATELEQALRLVATLPGATLKPASQLRRVYLTIDCHLYDMFDERHVPVRALWGARRHSGPRLRP